jgi:hypothetical protein
MAGVQLSGRVVIPIILGMCDFPSRICCRTFEHGHPLLHPQRPLFDEEIGKWTLKVAMGRNVPRPTLRDVLSRGLTAKFDTDDAKCTLGWSPVADRQHFIERGIRVFAKA